MSVIKSHQLDPSALRQYGYTSQVSKQSQDLPMVVLAEFGH